MNALKIVKPYTNMVTQGVNLYCIVSQICLCCIHIHKQLKQIVILDINKAK